jgi:hypothetical protein
VASLEQESTRGAGSSQGEAPQQFSITYASQYGENGTLLRLEEMSYAQTINDIKERLVDTIPGLALYGVDKLGLRLCGHDFLLIDNKPLLYYTKCRSPKLTLIINPNVRPTVSTMGVRVYSGYSTSVYSNQRKTFDVKVPKNGTIYDLVEQIYQKEARADFKIVFDGEYYISDNPRHLETTLTGAGIEDGDIVELFIVQRGGGFVRYQEDDLLGEARHYTLANISCLLLDIVQCVKQKQTPEDKVCCNRNASNKTRSCNTFWIDAMDLMMQKNSWYIEILSQG